MRTIGHFEELEQLGEGGMGVVLRCRDVLLERDVALKLLKVESPHLDRLRGRFVREVKVLARLRHPGIVQIFEFGTHEKVP